MDDLTLLEELGHGNYGTVQKVYHKASKVTMAMKEIRLELDESKLKAIITELDILHRATAPEIVDFYGAFFIESCVYYCMEYMNAGSLEKLAGFEVPEDVLARVTACTVRGLRFLKDKLQTMHRGQTFPSYLVKRCAKTLYRRQANKHPGQPSGRNQAMRFWRVDSAGAQSSENEHRLPVIHGCEYPP